MLHEFVTELISMLPERVGSFPKTQYPLPVVATFRGDKFPTCASVRSELEARADGDIKELLESVLLAAEMIESVADDRAEYFLTDQRVQRLVFQGSKWRAGWCLILGNKFQNELVESFLARQFLVFTDQPEIADTIYIGDRSTSPIYFLQLMVRYGLVWGQITPGDDHRMGHYLEDDMPGFIVITEDLPAAKYAVTLGLLKLGAPAIVPSSFPFPYGNRIVADSPPDIVDRGTSFPNLRVKYVGDEVISLPDGCNPALASEAFEPVRILGGNDSFFCMRPGDAAAGITKVIGEPGDATGTPAAAIGVLIEVAHKEFTVDISETTEAVALKSISYIPGVRADLFGDEFTLMADTDQIDATLIGEVIRAGVRLIYPQLSQFDVTIIFEPAELARTAKSVRTYQAERRTLIENMNEGNTDEFCVCTECRPFSLEHTCIITPDRLPMCASTTYFSVKAKSRFGYHKRPFWRSSEAEIPFTAIFDKGSVIDAKRGEYDGTNEIYRTLTQGKLDRVFLHSLRDYPHTSCGCFQNLAFWIDEVEGIAIMSRGSEAVAPGGQTWSDLANRAGGKQSAGIMGVSTQYITSANFLRGDGGLANLVWVDTTLHKRLKAHLPGNTRVATENDVSSIEELRQFVGR